MRVRPLTRLAALLNPRRLTLWGLALLALTLFVYIHTLAVPGFTDRVGRFKGADYTQFYVMGSLVLDGRTDQLYDAAAHIAEGRRRIVPTLSVHASHPNYGPQVALAFAPLAMLPFGWSLALFLVGATICYALSVWLIWRECSALRAHGRLVALLAAASPLFFVVLRYAQLSTFSLLLWAAALVALRRRRPLLAGLAIGCLIYKPQLGIVVGVVLLLCREWRIVCGAVMSAAAQLLVAWAAAGTATMMRYLAALWTLMLNPSLVQISPSEAHSIRGFVQLLIPSPPVVTACFLLGLAVALAAAVRSWSGSAPLTVRWGELIVLTVLASPHLLAYDLVLLTLPLLVFADWIVSHHDDPARPAVALLLVLVYLAPFSGQFPARLIRLQISVIVFAILAWRMYKVGVPGSDDARSSI
jgi:glycosyl transferase family 87